MACVTPIHKGDVELANNYRPVSLTSIPCKLMEHIILHYLNKALAKFFITDNMVSKEDCLVKPSHAQHLMILQKLLMMAILLMP